MLAQIPNAHAEVVTSLAFSPHITANPYTLCSTSGDDTAALWDCRSSANISRLTHHRGPVNHAVFLPSDANMLLTCADDRSIALWDLRRPDSVVGTITTGFADGVNKMLLMDASASGLPSCGGAGGGPDYLIASACDDGRVCIHALLPNGQTAEQPVAAPPVVAGFGQAATTTPTAMHANVGALVDSFWVSTSTVNDLILAPNKRVLITASEDCALRSWRLLYNPQANTDDRLIASLDEFENPVNHVVLVPPGLMEPSASTGAAVQSSSPSASQQTAAGDGDDDGAAAATTQNQTQESTTTVITHQYHNGEGSSSSGAVTEDTRCWLLAGCSEFTFGVDLCGHSGSFGSEARSYVGHTDYVRGLEFTHAGTLLTVSDDSTCIEWSVSTGEPVRQLKLHEGYVMASALSPQGDVMATGTDGGEIRVWHIPFGTERIGQ